MQRPCHFEIADQTGDDSGKVADCVEFCAAHNGAAMQNAVLGASKEMQIAPFGMPQSSLVPRCLRPQAVLSEPSRFSQVSRSSRAPPIGVPGVGGHLLE